MTARPRAVPELSVDVQVIEHRLSQVAVNGVCSYEELSALIKRDVQRHARHVLASAMRRLLREQGRVFAAVTNLGVKRLDDVGIVGTGRQAVQRLHRAAKRAGRRLEAVQDYGALPTSEQIRLNTQRALLGTIAQATRERQVKRLETRVGAQLAPTPQMLEAIKDTL